MIARPPLEDKLGFEVGDLIEWTGRDFTTWTLNDDPRFVARPIVIGPGFAVHPLLVLEIEFYPSKECFRVLALRKGQVIRQVGPHKAWDAWRVIQKGEE